MLKLNFHFVGEIIAAKLNANGSWHDSRVAQPIYEKLCIATPEGYYLVTDTAFPHGTDQIKGHICAPMCHDLVHDTLLLALTSTQALAGLTLIFAQHDV